MLMTMHICLNNDVNSAMMRTVTCTVVGVIIVDAGRDRLIYDADEAS